MRLGLDKHLFTKMIICEDSGSYPEQIIYALFLIEILSNQSDQMTRFFAQSFAIYKENL